jgi:hypothetical protein
MENKITYEDVQEYHHLFTMAPSFVLEMMARKNSNLVLKFKSTIQSHLVNLTDDQKYKLNVILDSDIDDLQAVMGEAYRKTGKKQYKILANTKYKDFIQFNLSEVRKLI